MPLVKLHWAVDKLKLFNELTREKKSDTVRGMLWLILCDKLGDSHVFVDDWPTYTHVCCLHTSKVYAPNSDRDLITLSTKNLSSMGLFLLSLFQERKWNDRQGIIGCWLEENILALLQSLLRQQYGPEAVFWTSYRMRCYTSHKRENLEEYKKQMEETLSSCPPGLTISDLKPEEAKLLADNWPHKIPEKEEMIRWLISILPSPCVRDKEGQPVAWGFAYSFCAPGGGYVLPEYRGRHIADLYGMRGMMMMQEICPMQIAHTIRVGNEASEHQTKRTTFDLQTNDRIVQWLVYDPSQRMKQPESSTAPKARL